ncbi:hypothetical protein BGZ73_000305 [Actinomortierella ambigua]|nr:hypothetical protein BGZ73_000305 [Actinomortierella ambigua]
MSKALPCFFYGSLMDPRVLNAVTRPEPGADHYAVRASIRGFIRYPYYNQPYPGIIPSEDPSREVEGILVFGHSDLERHRLDRFEGSEYPRSIQKIKVLDPVPARYVSALPSSPASSDSSSSETTEGVTAGTVMEAYAYVFEGPLEHLDLTREWDFEAFQRENCARWISASPDFATMIERSTMPFSPAFSETVV